MKRIAWKASYIVGGWFNRFSLHGEVEVPEPATEAEIEAAIREHFLEGHTFTHREIGA